MNYNCEISKKISNLALEGEEFIFAIDYSMQKGFVMAPKDAADSGIYYDIEGQTNCEKKNYLSIKKKFEVFPPRFSDYKNAFDSVQKHIKRGDTFLVNLSFKSKLETEYSLDEIFHRSNAKFKLLYKDKFVVFSPERFIRICDNKMESFPMKGTIDADLPDAENILLNSDKEFCEHTTIVDLIRNDMNIVAQSVCVESFRYIDRIHSNRGNLLQVSSKISGILVDNFRSNLGDIIFKMLPAGSVTGAPKEKTLDIISEAETYQRGFYTGIFGYYNGKDLNSAVTIRFIENENGNLYYKSGGGITAQSSVNEEYDELIRKIYVPLV